MAKQEFTCALVLLMWLIVGQVNCELPAGFERCDNSGAIVEDFQLRNCLWDGVPMWPCGLLVGQALNFKLDFSSPKDFSKAEMHFALEKSQWVWDACSKNGMKRLNCPAKEGDLQTLDVKFHIDEVLRRGSESDTMKIFVTDADTKEQLVCVQFPVRVKQGW